MRFVVLILVFVFLCGGSAQKDNTEKGDVVKAKECGHCQNSLTSCGMPGMPGSNGMPGMPGVQGLPGRDGVAVVSGKLGPRGVKGSKGEAGNEGKIGANGTKGEKGDAGDYGPQGSQGVAGTSGKLGPRGAKGSKGEAGDEGKIGGNGTKGEKGDAATTNPTQRVNYWKQCVWNSGSGADSGKIKECSFNKLHQSSAVRVSYQGNMRVMGSPHCNRWFFKFNGSECSGPMTIEATVYNSWSSAGNPNLLHHRSFEGYCENLGRGTVSVELWVGQCSKKHTLGDAYTGGQSVSRIMIEEVPPSQ